MPKISVQRKHWLVHLHRVNTHSEVKVTEVYFVLMHVCQLEHQKVKLFLSDVL